MHTVDSRISKIVNGMKENEMAIEHIQTQLYDSFKNMEQSFSTMNVLLAKQIEKSRKLEHRFTELLMGIYHLVEGKLSPPFNTCNCNANDSFRYTRDTSQ